MYVCKKRKCGGASDEDEAATYTQANHLQDYPALQEREREEASDGDERTAEMQASDGDEGTAEMQASDGDEGTAELQASDGDEETAATPIMALSGTEGSQSSPEPNASSGEVR